MKHLLNTQLRRLGPSDAAAYRQLMLQAYATEAANFTSSARERAAAPLATWEQRLIAHTQQAEALWGAWEGAELVGALGLRADSGERVRHKAELFGMFVKTSCRRQGWARRLLGAALDHASHCIGLRQLRLTVSAGNSGAIALYRSQGFEITGTEPLAVRTGNEFIDKHLMCKFLPDDSATWQLADSEVAQVWVSPTWSAAGRPVDSAPGATAPPASDLSPPDMQIHLSAAQVERRTAENFRQTGFLPGLVLDLWLDAQHLEPAVIPQPTGDLIGRLRQGILHVASRHGWQRHSQIALPVPAAWEVCGDSAPLKLELNWAQGDSLSLPLRGLRCHWPMGAVWKESLAC